MNIADDLLRLIAQRKAVFNTAVTNIYLGSNKWTELMDHRAAQLFIQLEANGTYKFYGVPVHRVATSVDHVGIA